MTQRTHTQAPAGSQGERSADVGHVTCANETPTEVGSVSSEDPGHDLSKVVRHAPRLSRAPKGIQLSARPHRGIAPEWPP